MKVAIVHDYLNQAGGAERVVGTLHSMFPDAPIFTTILDRGTLWPSLRDADIRTSWMQGLPGLKRHFKKYLPFYPAAIESFRLQEYDLVISSSSAFAHGAVTAPEALHICYCHTPMRFAWDYERYVARESLGSATRLLLRPLIRSMQRWDLKTAKRPNVYVVNSSVVAERVRRLYGQPSEIIPPPVDLGRYEPSSTIAEYFLVVSRLNTYKRIDLVVDAFNKLGRSLLIVGDGPERAALQHRAKSNVRFIGHVPDEQVARHYAECQAVIFPGEEDFGIVPLEANASGRPVIAFRKGGALDTVIDGRTGVFFDEQSVASLCDAIHRCESISWVARELRVHASEFDEAQFRTRFLSVVRRNSPMYQ